MTSFVIKDHEHREIPSTWKPARGSRCAFCRIVRGEAPAYKLYENDSVIAILDIAPLRPGHTLVIPKTHISRVSDLPDELAAQCGLAVSKMARAISTALQNTALNVVCNQEYAQAVPHVHYHIIPAPRPESQAGANTMGDPSAQVVPALARREARDHVTRPLTEKEMLHRELEARSGLEESEAEKLVEIIRARL
ncbi:HIT-like protein [Daedaleopsis nitida]|nr:HIT-like protein [Daedaleopsis nitida]